MIGSLNSNRDFYQGRYKDFYLKALVAKESCSKDQLSLLRYLGRQEIYDEGRPYKDNKAVIACLYFLPPSLIIPVLVRLYIDQQERYLIFSTDPESIDKIFTLICKAKELPMGDIQLRMMRSFPSSKERIKEMYRYRESLDIQGDVGYMLEDLDQASKEELLYLLESGDKVRSASLLCQDWGWSAGSINKIREIICSKE